MSKNIQFPFSAVVGQDDFKLALILCVIDPTIGGVLALGDKGTGKTTLVRSLSSLMAGHNGEFPFVNLPIGATEDRVLGNVDIEKLINDKKQVVNQGLLARAHKGILYIDEINLLNDYLMDVLLDASSSGSYYLERDGISQWFDSRFCLVGTMNPEEGELRPQLKDRFGLSVHIATPRDHSVRAQITKNRILFDSAPEVFVTLYSEEEALLQEKIVGAKTMLKEVEVGDEMIVEVSEMAIKNNVEGMRADILVIKAARAYAAYEGRSEVEVSDIQKVAPFVFNHRTNENPSQQPPFNNSNPSDNEKKRTY